MKKPLISLFFFLFLLLIPPTTPSPATSRRRLTDTTIHSAALRSYPRHHKTAVPYNVSLPPSLSAAAAAARAMRFRSGRLRRKGATFNPFRLPPGLVARPHSKRLLIVFQNLGDLSPSLYSLPHHRLISPVLGLLIYDAIGANSTELDVRATKEPIEVDFSEVAGVEEIKEGFLCAVFGLGGRVEVEVLGRGKRVCFVKGEGHFGLVVERGRERWKAVVAVAVAVAAAVAVAMMGLVVVAVVKGRRKESRRGEMERRACENEALRECMVGSRRVYTAAPVRTSPEIEREDGLAV